MPVPPPLLGAREMSRRLDKKADHFPVTNGLQQLIKNGIQGLTQSFRGTKLTRSLSRPAAGLLEFCVTGHLHSRRLGQTLAPSTPTSHSLELQSQEHSSSVPR